MNIVGHLIMMIYLLMAALLYLIFVVFIYRCFRNKKKAQLLCLILLICLPISIATLNYYGFCFKKMKFLNEHDIYAILDNSEYKAESNECYGVYIFATEKVYGCFEKDPESGYLYDTGDKFFNFVPKILGFAYARVQVREENEKITHHFLLMDNCGNLYHSEF